jgi:1-acyl-sn-glycerol-3-phosphate acyltransferase
MLNFLPAPLIFLLSFTLYLCNTIVWLIPIILFSFLKAIVPLPFWQKLMSYLLDAMASNWVALNTVNQLLFTKMKVEVTGLEKLEKKQWYLVISNHQTWVDIVILQRILHSKIPFLKFFLKRELIYVPLLGLAWWALDFPFMKRYSQSFIKKNPHLKGKDVETTKKACEKFKHKPVSIMNFVEGTRFTKQKHQQQNSPFQHLLKPKAGGIGFVLSTMGEQLNKVLDVTIYYPNGIPNFVDFLSGRIHTVHVAIDIKAVDKTILGDYVNDRSHRIAFQKWVNQLWYNKNQMLHNFSTLEKKDDQC